MIIDEAAQIITKNRHTEHSLLNQFSIQCNQKLCSGELKEWALVKAHPNN